MAVIKMEWEEMNRKTSDTWGYCRPSHGEDSSGTIKNVNVQVKQGKNLLQ